VPWLMRNDQDIQNVTQEVRLRAFVSSTDIKAGIPGPGCCPSHGFELLRNSDPEIQVPASADRETLHRPLEELPGVFREALVLRELKEMSYNEIADVTSSFMGAVMSRAPRPRIQLWQAVSVKLSRGY